MAPSLLSPNILHVLLQYISPPSQLTQPIPPHLLSKPLLQRHHFLHLTPEHPHDYLCWPSSPENKARVVHLLETRSRPLDDDQPSVFPVQYSFDGEYFFAHVDLSTDTDQGLRVILQWDESGEWKYHNTSLMPFPPGSRLALEDVLVPPSPPSPASLQPFARPSYLPTHDVGDLHDDSDDDDYWNAYGATDIGDSHYGQGAPAPAKGPASSEDAYWAQYASVHGTADSTVPSRASPAPRRKPLPALQQLDGQKMDSPLPLPFPARVPYECEGPYVEPLPIPPGIIARNNTRWDPASPTTLAHLLSTISPRASPAPDSQFNLDADLEGELSSPTIGGSDDSDLSSSPALGLEGTDIEAVAAQGTSKDFFAPVPGSITETKAGVVAAGNGTDGDEDEADLRAALEGVWRMWKKTRGKAAGLRATFGDCEAREAFMRTAQLVVDGV